MCSSSNATLHIHLTHLFALLRTNKVNVRVDCSSGDDEFLSSDNFCRRAHDEVFVHTSHHVWVSRLADTADDTVLDSDIRLVDSRPVDNEGICDEEVNALRRWPIGRLSHPLSNHLAYQTFRAFTATMLLELTSTKLAFISVYRLVSFDFDPQLGISKANKVTSGRPEHGSIRFTTDSGIQANLQSSRFGDMAKRLLNE